MKTSVRHHVRRTPSGGVTGVVRHERTLGDHATRTTTTVERKIPTADDQKVHFWNLGEKKAGLTSLEAEEYSEFMSRAFKGQYVTDSYALEWANRFKEGKAWDSSDFERRAELKKVMPEKYKDFKDTDTEYVEPYNNRVKNAVRTDRVDSYRKIFNYHKPGQRYVGYTSYVDGTYVGYFTPNRNDVVERAQIARAQKKYGASHPDMTWKPGED